MVLKRKWLHPSYDMEKVDSISKKFNISDIIAKILVGRDITDDKEVYDFLHTDDSQFFDPFLLPDMGKSVERVKKALQTHEKIAVFGDYDVDGITSTYILYDYLTSLNADVSYYIPDRASEGYGLNKTAIESLCHEGVRLIVTVDSGITAVEETEFAKECNIDIIITDHHTPSDILPKAYALINPKLDWSEYPNSNLAGVGVAFKLVYALSGCDKKIFQKYCEYACIGTIADMVTLTGENRYICICGLEKIKNTSNIGLTHLIDAAGLDINNITASNVGFSIAPRLNAVGRISSAKTSVELLLTKEASKASELALFLDEENKIRQKTEQDIFEKAIEAIESQKLFNDNVIVVAGKDWHHGVIGIVSSKITEKYYKPSLVISTSDSEPLAKASGRSISGFNIIDALSNCADLLEKYGGHELAAGFSVKKENIDAFRVAINKYASQIITEDILTPKIQIDACIVAKDINLTTAKELKKLEPHGIGNRTPVFMLEGANVKTVKIHKSGKHAFVTFKKGKSCFFSPAFNMADKLCAFGDGDHLDMVGNISINSFKGSDSAQFIIKDTSPVLQSDFNIDNLRCIFVVIKDYLSLGFALVKPHKLSQDVKARFSLCFSEERITKALDVFSELSLIEMSSDGDCVRIIEGRNFHSKIDITSSKTYKEINCII